MYAINKRWQAALTNLVTVSLNYVRYKKRWQTALAYLVTVSLNYVRYKKEMAGGTDEVCSDLSKICTL